MKSHPGQPVHMLVLMVAMIGNAIIWGLNSFLQFHAKLESPDGFGLSELERGIILGIVSLVGGLSCTVWGALSDRTNTRWGKRKPYMFVFPPLVLVSFWITASVDVLFGMSSVFWTLLAFFMIKAVVHNGANVPYTTVIPEVVPAEKRVDVSQLNVLIQGIGFAVGAVVPTLLFEAFDAFAVPFIVAGAIMIVLYLVSSTAIPSTSKPIKSESALHALRSTLRDRNFMMFQVAQFAWTLSLNIIIFILPFLAQDLLGVSDESVYGWFFLSFLAIAGVLLLALNVFMRKRRVEKKKTLIFFLCMTAATVPLVGFIGSPVFGFMPVLVQTYIFGTLVFGGLMGIFIFPYAIMMALIDYDSGNEATYNGTNGTILGISAIPAGPIGGILVSISYPAVGIICGILIVVAIVIFTRVHVPERLFEKSA